MSVAEKIEYINRRLPETTKLLAISKFHPSSLIQEAYDAGQRLFGESREQELSQKQAELPKDIEWHFIGHLQTNKVKYIAPYVSMIHSVDSVRLLEEINKQAQKCGRVIDCLLELHVAQEETKFGFSFDDVRQLYAEDLLSKYPNVHVRGLMGMASHTDNDLQVRREFASIAAFFAEMQQKYDATVDTLSMGMTNDWKIAVEEGSTMVRIGSYIFGDRVY
ncbi:MAG: YggS family pyridoxal phosphate-dependent enzyme [Paludibacteraceae bacterium]|nr:YggS family pyridoxal phosphate-dependent enzyme [Paludibacteraceae bacterium]